MNTSVPKHPRNQGPIVCCVLDCKDPATLTMCPPSRPQGD